MFKESWLMFIHFDTLFMILFSLLRVGRMAGYDRGVVGLGEVHADGQGRVRRGRGAAPEPPGDDVGTSSV